jgi:hypothetical protein
LTKDILSYSRNIFNIYEWIEMDILNTIHSALGRGKDDKQNDLVTSILDLLGGLFEKK